MNMLTKNDIAVLTKDDFGPPDLLGNGKTAKQYRDEILERTRKSGFYNGLGRLELREKVRSAKRSCSPKSAAVWCTPARPPRRSPQARSWSTRVSCASPYITQRATAS